MTGRIAQNAVATAQIIGDRDNQEDSMATHELEADVGEHGGVLLLILVDGMGGHAGGEIATTTIARVMLKRCRNVSVTGFLIIDQIVTAWH